MSGRLRDAPRSPCRSQPLRLLSSRLRRSPTFKERSQSAVRLSRPLTWARPLDHFDPYFPAGHVSTGPWSAGPRHRESAPGKREWSQEFCHECGDAHSGTKILRVLRSAPVDVRKDGWFPEPVADRRGFPAASTLQSTKGWSRRETGIAALRCRGAGWERDVRGSA